MNVVLRREVMKARKIQVRWPTGKHGGELQGLKFLCEHMMKSMKMKTDWMESSDSKEQHDNEVSGFSICLRYSGLAKASNPKPQEAQPNKIKQNKNEQTTTTKNWPKGQVRCSLTR